MVMSINQKHLVQVKDSVNYWAQQHDAARVLIELVFEMGQVLAEAQEECKLGDKRALVEEALTGTDDSLAEALTTLRADHRGAALANHYNSLATWFAVMAKSRTFADWNECQRNFMRVRTYFHAHQAAVIANSVRLEAHFKQLADSYRKDIQSAASKLLPPVAMNKAVRKEAVKMFIVKHTTLVTSISNDNLYKLARYDNARKQMQEYGFNMTYAIWNRAIAIRSLGRNWYVGSI